MNYTKYAGTIIITIIAMMVIMFIMSKIVDWLAFHYGYDGAGMILLAATMILILLIGAGTDLYKNYRKGK